MLTAPWTWSYGGYQAFPALVWVYLASNCAILGDQFETKTSSDPKKPSEHSSTFVTTKSRKNHQFVDPQLNPQGKRFSAEPSKMPSGSASAVKPGAFFSPGKDAGRLILKFFSMVKCLNTYEILEGY